MVPIEDLIGLGLGALYMIGAPILAFVLLRNPLVLKVRYLLLGAVGVMLATWLGAVISVALSSVFVSLARSARPAHAMDELFREWVAYASFPLGYLLVAMALLAFFSAGRQRLPAALAYAIGAYGLLGVSRSFRLWQQLGRALAVNDFGTASVFGPKFYVSDSTLQHMFSYGIPSAASSIVRMLLGVVLALLIAQGLLRKNWKPFALAFAVAIGYAGMRAASGALSLALAAPTAPFGTMEQPLTGYEIESVLGIVIIIALSWRSGFRRLMSAPDDGGQSPGEPPAKGGQHHGLLGVWLDQGARSER